MDELIWRDLGSECEQFEAFGDPDLGVAQN